MTVPTNPFKAALKAGTPQVGLWVALGNPLTAEICAGAGFDWLLIDGEHGPNDVPLLLSQLQAIAPYPSHPVGRPPLGETHIIKQYLDIGFTTLLVPFVETAADAERLVQAVRYPPAGVRGVGPGMARASRWNRIPGYLQGADEEICLVVQIETRQGLDNLEAIAAVDGVDAVFIGPADLSAALGHRGDPGHPEVQAEIERAIPLIRAAGKAAGAMSIEETLAKRFFALGCSFVGVATDTGLFARTLEATADRFKAAAPKGAATTDSY